MHHQICIHKTDFVIVSTSNLSAPKQTAEIHSYTENQNTLVIS